MTNNPNVTDAPDRSQLHFAQQVLDTFLFLTNEGFTELEASPTLVRYRNGDVEVDVYHGRRSYEIGGGITAFGTRYAISEIMLATDPEAANIYRNAMATTPEGVGASLKELSTLMQRYCVAALRGDSQFFSLLEEQRRHWAEEYALDVIEDQLRPQAEDAFRRGDYSIAAELYGRIRERLSPTEVKKLALAEERRELPRPPRAA
ncbi:MAG: hypothetical protein OEL88_08540 [Sterolibacteriaceae bacterium MAG5]|nr:hypothetical protein [Candidatus Nitricoxidireducens bremensis]